jgi:predicted N-formylglutamate amidohydrolase
VGDNQPYSGRDLNYTMNRHAEALRIPYLGIEVRNDGLQTKEGVARWTHILADCIAMVRRRLLGARRPVGPSGVSRRRGSAVSQGWLHRQSGVR